MLTILSSKTIIQNLFISFELFLTTSLSSLVRKMIGKELDFFYFLPSLEKPLK